MLSIGRLFAIMNICCSGSQGCRLYVKRVGINLVIKRLEQIRRILKDYDDNEIDRIYTKEHPERQKLVREYLIYS